MQMLTPLIMRTKIVVTAAVVVSLFPTNAFFGGMRHTRVDRDRAHHPASVLWVIVARVCDAMVAWGTCGTEGWVTYTVQHTLD